MWFSRHCGRRILLIIIVVVAVVVAQPYPGTGSEDKRKWTVVDCADPMVPANYSVDGGRFDESG